MTLTNCTTENCKAEFIYIASRQHPTLCIDHSADASRNSGWTPENSVN